MSTFFFFSDLSTPKPTRIASQKKTANDTFPKEPITARYSIVGPRTPEPSRDGGPARIYTRCALALAAKKASQITRAWSSPTGEKSHETPRVYSAAAAA